MPILHDIVQNGLSPSLMMFNNIIEGMCKEGRPEESLKLLGKMKDAGVEPSQFTLNFIYGCLAERCDVAGALDLLKKMRFRPSLSKDSVRMEGLLMPVNTLMMWLEKVSLVTWLPIELFRDIGPNGHCLDVIVYNVLIKALCKAYRTT